MESKELGTVLHNCLATMVALFMFGLMKGGADGCGMICYVLHTLSLA